MRWGFWPKDVIGPRNDSKHVLFLGQLPEKNLKEFDWVKKVFDQIQPDKQKDPYQLLSSFHYSRYTELN